jgi:hypothetical protein
MSVNGASTGKASVQEPSSSRPHGLVNVQLARLGDLQPRYAATIQHDDDNPDAHSWYAKLSKWPNNSREAILAINSNYLIVSV